MYRKSNASLIDLPEVEFLDAIYHEIAPHISFEGRPGDEEKRSISNSWAMRSIEKIRPIICKSATIQAASTLGGLELVDHIRKEIQDAASRDPSLFVSTHFVELIAVMCVRIGLGDICKRC